MYGSQLPGESPLSLELSGGDSAWTQQNQLLAGIADLLAGANWQRAGKGPKPKPIKRPGVGPEVTVLAGNTALSKDKLDVLLDRYVGPRTPKEA